ncbi:hypothetical protein [Polaromonas sp.]
MAGAAWSKTAALGADAVFDKATEIEEFTKYAVDEVERVAGSTHW